MNEAEGHILLERKTSEVRGWKLLKLSKRPERPGHFHPFRVLEHLLPAWPGGRRLGDIVTCPPQEVCLGRPTEVTSGPRETFRADAQGWRPLIGWDPSVSS